MAHAIEDAIQVLKHIRSLKGDYQGFAEHANSRDIHTISKCCFNLLRDNIPLPKSMKRAIKVFLKPMSEEIKTLATKNESIEKKRKLLLLSDMISFFIGEKTIFMDFFLF